VREMMHPAEILTQKIEQPSCAINHNKQRFVIYNELNPCIWLVEYTAEGNESCS
jgi:hypothetical protein